MMRIKAHYEGPYTDYAPARDGDTGRSVFEADESLYEQYVQAEKAFREAEDKLSGAHEKFLWRRLPLQTMR